MNEMKSSKDLLQIIEHAVGMMQKHDIRKGSMTAEKLLLAALDLYGDPTYRESNPDIAELLKIRLQAGDIRNCQNAKDKLLFYISASTASYLDSLYMSKIQKKAVEAAQKAAQEELSAKLLLTCIFDEPSETIRQLMKESEEGGDVSDHSETLDVTDLFENLFGEDSSASSENTEKDPGEVETGNETETRRDQLAEVVAKTQRVRDELLKRIYGQNHAVDVFASGYFQSELVALTDKERFKPKATYLLAGPPGVGKTYLAENAARILGLPFMRFDMSEYADHYTVQELSGTDGSYKNAKEGSLTSFVAKNPKSILLFDEIEKADGSVINLFLQILDAGRLRDNFTDNTVSFKDSVLVFTTNAGKQLYENDDSGDFSHVSRKVILDALGKDINPKTDQPFFPAAICSRFASGNVVMMNRIKAHDLCTIVRNEICNLSKRYEESFGIHFDIDERVYMALLFSLGGNVDARTARSRAVSFFNDELYELFRLISSPDIGRIETIHIGLTPESEVKEVRSLFEANEPQTALLFGGRTDPDCGDLLRVLKTASLTDARDALGQNPPAFSVLDPGVGMDRESSYLNIEDIRSDSRELLRILLEEHGEIPVYLLDGGELSVHSEQRISYLNQGVRGFLDGAANLAEQLKNIAAEMHLQHSMNELARANKLVTFETAQALNGPEAVIRLFDFRMSTAVNAEDSENILSNLSRPNVRFEDVIGAEDAKEELQYFVRYLKNPKSFAETGVQAPKGILLYGPPGTGKTMLAKALATESGATFIAAEGNQFLQRYVGEGPARVHELFRVARRYAPSILFVDEIDAIAMERNGSDHTNITGDILTAFLAEMDGFKNDPTRPVFVLAATNFEVEPGSLKSLDAALMRRFDRRIMIDLPNREERIRYLRLRMLKQPSLELSEEKLASIGVRSTGMSLAALESVIELALRTSIREGKNTVTDEVFDEAFETFNSGERKSWDAKLLERVARHEAGHAYLCWKSGETPSYLTVVARSNHGGYMQHDDSEGKAIYTKEELLARIRTALGGRAAEIVYYGEEDGVTTGASGDFETATSLARQMICSYGMDESFGLAAVDAQSARMGEASSEVRRTVNAILAEEMGNAVSLIREGKDRIDRLVGVLMEKNHLAGAEIEAVLNTKVINL